MVRRKLIVIASRSGAKLYEQSQRNGPLEIVRELDNPEGRLRTQDINSDRQGRNYSSGTGVWSSYSAEHPAKEHVARTFAREVAQELELEAYRNQWDSFILVAEPRLLGMIKAELGTNANAKISHFVQKDLGKVSNRDLPEYLQEVI